ncbi:ATP synthase F0 subunit B [candidate division WOR-1 bacterium RIFOXYB2_FULL_42_35]|uniref:ATP synthase subunit b n=1 Tax=candidate division WOR-1 bacterium RIFOXYC2_FULL_41_25 TaxID=1802586 RepID=A0A1F4TJC1_UNCSA|nr:MAG: ATP synthase F0 subunit B [candidate division WOR-1 bacterium RIFOXYA2_FULL_41_14]OGC22061.1 MAG: ATP synthase F0 subunit B [candidate division WOR-1 bacterium RIFOXYB2_FULL_42_35]OGC32822.1 MAG: ATP synthase F0 subunit B [candidate division WOR-1 bacterium RIFOXYC2_FULL_41_25]
MFEINTGLIFWTVVSFILLLVLLYRLVFPPLNRILDQRKKAIEGRLEQAETAQKEAEGLLDKYHLQLAEAEKKTAAMFAEARRQTQTFREDSLENAQKEARGIIEKTKEDIEILRRKSMQNLKEDIANIVVDVNRRLIKSELSNKDHLVLVDSSIKELEKNVKRKI